MRCQVRREKMCKFMKLFCKIMIIIITTTTVIMMWICFALMISSFCCSWSSFPGYEFHSEGINKWGEFTVNIRLRGQVMGVFLLSEMSKTQNEKNLLDCWTDILWDKWTREKRVLFLRVKEKEAWFLEAGPLTVCLRRYVKFFHSSRPSWVEMAMSPPHWAWSHCGCCSSGSSLQAQQQETVRRRK